MRTLRWTFAALDKEDGVVTMKVDEWRALHLSILDGKDYESVMFPDDEVNKMRFEYPKLCVRIACGNAVLQKALLRSLNSPGAAHSATLRLLVKSHKTPVTVRNVHC